MTEMHKQALESIYRQVLQRLINAQGEGQRVAILRLAEYIGRRCPALEEARLVVLCSGDRDGLLAMAQLRGAQLLLAEAQGRTFRLRVVIPALPGLSPVDDGNLQRAMAALFLLEDHRVDILGVSHIGLYPYERMAGGHCRKGQGLALLQASRGTAAATRWHSRDLCLLAAAHLLWCALEKGASGDIWVTAQPLRALLRQGARARHVLRAAGALGAHEQVPCPSWLPRLAGVYKGRASGGVLVTQVPMPCSVHRFLPATHKLRWQLAMECLGMQLDPFSLRREALGCEDTLLSAHLAALSACHYQGDAYAAGLASWLKPRFEQLRREGIPVRKLAALRTSCLGERAVDSQQYRLQLHVEERYGVSDTQLCCLLFQPFAGGGAHLRLFLERCHPDQACREGVLRRALEGHAVATEEVRWLERVAGVALPVLRRLYAQPPGTPWVSAASRPSLCSCIVNAAGQQPSTLRLAKAEAGVVVPARARG
jgi:hypothetical protein